jgi:Glutathione S-transferase, N-terminal domain
VRLVDAPRCPYCARARLVLAEKAIEFERVEIDLGNRPDWVYELNASGKVPILDDGFVLPESPVIMEYLEERFPAPPLLPADAAGRARARLSVFRFDELLGDDYYAFRRGERNDLEGKLDALPVGSDLFVDLAYVPWVLRARELLDVALPERLSAWLEGLLARPSVAAELALVRGLA